MTCAPITPAIARIRRAVKAAISLNGGIDGAAATCGKSRSLIGNFNCRDRAETPCLADAFALDEVAAMQGKVPPVASALAAELGCVLIRLPDGGSHDGELAGALVDAAAEFGDVAQRLRAGLADGVMSMGERFDLVQQIDEAQAALARMRALAQVAA